MASQSQVRMKKSTSAFVLSIRSQSNQHSLEAYFFRFSWHPTWLVRSFLMFFLRWSQQILQFKAEDLNLRMKASDEASRALVEVVNERADIISQSQHDIEVISVFSWLMFALWKLLLRSTNIYLTRNCDQSKTFSTCWRFSATGSNCSNLQEGFSATSWAVLSNVGMWLFVTKGMGRLMRSHYHGIR